MNSHWLLIISWTGYCILHSFLADNRVKSHIQKFMGASFKYYRPLYSMFAVITLALLLWFQYSMQSSWLFNGTALTYLPGIIIGMAGLIMMLICINKYFYEISGLKAIQHSQIKNTLQQSGLHKYVRHPLYLGTLLFIWGLFVIFPLTSNLIAVSVITIYVMLGIRIEEKKLYLEHGETYTEYTRKVPKLIPRIYINKKGSV